MTSVGVIENSESAVRARTHLLRTITPFIFIVFFQTYMVAPLIPSLAEALHASRERVGLLIPAYTIPYALAALVCGAVADHFGRRGLLFFSLVSFPIMSFAMAAAPSLDGLLLFRVISGATNVGIAVTGLSLIADLFPLGERGRAIGWVFGAIAGGGAFGSTFGGILSPVIGWRGLFVLVGVTGVVLLVRAMRLWGELKASEQPSSHTAVAQYLSSYLSLLRNPRGGRTYAYIFLNAVFHSGVFTWLGVLLHDRYGLGEAGIGLALLGYGVPGLFLGPTIGKIVDRHGRRYIIPVGLLLAASTAAILAGSAPLIIAAIAITILSLGFDMTHPLFAGIATTLDDRRRGQAMGLNAFSIFLGFGVGSLIFGRLAQQGMPRAFVVFAVMQGTLGIAAIFLFHSE